MALTVNIPGGPSVQLNGWRALLIIAAMAIVLTVCITVITITEHDVPNILGDALFILVAAAAGGGLVDHLNGRKP